MVFYSNEVMIFLLKENEPRGIRNGPTTQNAPKIPKSSRLVFCFLTIASEI